MPAAAHGERAALLWLALIGATIAAIVVATPAAFRNGGDHAYMALAIATGLLALLATRVSERAPLARALWVVIAVAIGLRLYLLFLDPLLSSDVYRYVWDGKVQGHFINPYRYIPAAPELQSLRDGAVFPNVNRADYAVTAYPPVAQIFFFLVTRFGETVTVMKIGFLACEAVTVAVIWGLLRKLGRPATGIVGYLWHPLPMWEIANNGHIDALMAALLMAGIWLALSGRNTLGAVIVGLSGLAKPMSLAALPAFWRPWDMKAPLAVIAAVAVCYLPYLSVGWGVFGFVTQGYLAEESYTNGGMIWPLVAWRAVFGAGRWEYPVYAGLAFLVMAALVLRASGRRSVDAAGLLRDVRALLLAFLLLLSPNYSWYFLLLTPFVALSGGATFWAATIGAFLLHEEASWDYFVPLEYRKTILYSAVAIAFGYSRWRWRRQGQEGRQI